MVKHCTFLRNACEILFWEVVIAAFDLLKQRTDPRTLIERKNTGQPNANYFAREKAK